MTAKILTARQMRDRFVFVIHLDTTRLGADGKPDPAWLLRREWPLKLTAEKTAYLAAIKAELQAAAVEQIAHLRDEEDGGIALPMEGATIG
jgi:hypothetical protein